MENKSQSLPLHYDSGHVFRMLFTAQLREVVVAIVVRVCQCPRHRQPLVLTCLLVVLEARRADVSFHPRTALI